MFEYSIGFRVLSKSNPDPKYQSYEIRSGIKAEPNLNRINFSYRVWILDMVFMSRPNFSREEKNSELIGAYT